MSLNPHTKALKNKDKSLLLEIWVKKYSRVLLKYFQKRTVSSVDSDDLVQEVFARLARRADLSNIENVEGYLFQSASSVLTDFHRRGTVRHQSAHEPFEEKTHNMEGISLERVLIGEEYIDILIEALYQLPERTQHIFVLYHFESYRYKDIADRLGVGVSTVEKHMAKANAYLLNVLEGIK